MAVGDDDLMILGRWNNLLHVEREVTLRVLKETDGNQVKASALLGITRATLRKRIEIYRSED